MKSPPTSAIVGRYCALGDDAGANMSGMTDSGAAMPKLRQIVLDCEDARKLAEFYRQLLASPTAQATSLPMMAVPIRKARTGWCSAMATASAWRSNRCGVCRSRPGQRDRDRRCCIWTPACRHSTTCRLQHQRALGLGARLLLDRSDDPDEPLFVYADLAGHPFCIFVAAD
jgi:hypothetical protein